MTRKRAPRGPGRRVIILGMLLVCAAAVLSVYLLTLEFKPAETLHGPSPLPQDVSAMGSPTAPPPKDAAPIVRAEPADRAEGVDNSRQKPGEPAADPVTVTLWLKDSESQPLSDMPIRYRIATRKEYRTRFAMASSGHVDFATPVAFTGNSAVSDDAGRVTLTLPQRDRDIEEHLMVAPSDQGRWTPIQPQAGNRQSLPIWGRGVWTSILPSTDASFTIVMLAKRRVVVPIWFADQLPFSGEVRVLLRGSGRCDAWMTTTRLEGVTELTFDAPANVRRVSFLCHSLRYGFKGNHSFSAEGEWLANPTPIVIPAVNPHSQAGLAVDLTGYYEQDGWTLTLRHRGAQTATGLVDWGNEFRTLDLIAGHEYSVRLERANGQFWQCEEFEAVAGRIVHLKPELTATTVLRLRVVDRSGQTIVPSYSSIRKSGLPNWKIASAAQGQVVSDPAAGWAYCNASGLIELADVPASTPTLFVEADGYERREIALALREHEAEHDLGDIVLQRASGALNVELQNFPPGADFVVRLADARGRPISSKAVTGSQLTVEFDALPFRAYTVLIGRTRGNELLTIDGTREPVRLSPEQPTAKAILDYDNPLFPDNKVR